MPAAPVEGPEEFSVPRPAVTGLAGDPRLPIWIRRAAISIATCLIVTLWQGWRFGLTGAALVAIVDTIYHSKTVSLIPAAARVSSARRRSKRRLFLARTVGYQAVHARAVPGTDSVIDHIVVGPAGVFAVDSERWDRRLPVRTVASESAAGAVLYHGPFSQKNRLAHARWEAAQASRLLSADLGRDIQVQPVMIIYGPVVPWAVTNLRGVDVLGGRSVFRYFRTRSLSAAARPLGWEEAGDIWGAAERTLPPA